MTPEFEVNSREYPYVGKSSSCRPILALRNAMSEIEVAPERFSSITALRHFPALPGSYEDFPADLDSRLVSVLKARGIERLYSHQSEAFERAHNGENVVVVTPTASGKTLCYNLPVLNTFLDEPGARALYLFPTKALSQDQLAELLSFIEELDADIRTFTYDGDTPQDARKAIRRRGHLVVTNPDMLHTGILPHHPKWVKLFENLRYVVIDEVHAYRGVFGSHLANILRRLRRICRFYGSKPQFICSSATIANPKELTENLIGEPVHLIERNGAPRGEKFFLFYNPPVVNRQLGIRRSYINETRRIALSFLEKGLQTIVFALSRLHTEVLVTYLKEAFEESHVQKDLIRGYRGGYLPQKRREIEQGLREGTVLGVVSTNALELGIDIGNLDVAVLAGYPGTIASTWQQSGRAGRRTGASIAVLIANSSPLNQFVVNHPDYFFSGSPEHGLINPDNLSILVDHIKCAAFELPFRRESVRQRESPRDSLFLRRTSAPPSFGRSLALDQRILPRRLRESPLRELRQLRRGRRDEQPTRVGEVDFASAFSTLHEKAIYIVEGQQYFVEHFDYNERRATVRQCETDYFTTAITHTKVNILDRFDSGAIGAAVRSHGEVHVVSQVVGFKKIKFYTMENVGSGELDMPEQEMHTTSYWLTIPRGVLAYAATNPNERRDGVVGLANTLKTIAMLYLMCDGSDIGVAIGDNSQGTASVESGFKRLQSKDALSASSNPMGSDYEPNIFIYDNYPGGIGFSEPLYRLHFTMLQESKRLIESCPCLEGCPSCVGPTGEVGVKGKEVALVILERILAG